MSRLLNIGCGARFHPDWTNVDAHPVSALVIRCDVVCGLPFPDATFDAVYHSHVLEHLRRDEATDFIAECHRLLKPGGILRIAVPDLEQIARLYLTELEEARSSVTGAMARCDWMRLELLDQMTRERTCGGFLDYFRSPESTVDFPRTRWGQAADSLQQMAKDDCGVSIAGVNPSRLRERGIWRLLEAFRVGRFRLAGEVHHWMYDEVSLRQLLEASGFEGVRKCKAAESQIERWHSYALDCELDGNIYKPDSLFMECRRRSISGPTHGRSGVQP